MIGQTGAAPFSAGLGFITFTAQDATPAAPELDVRLTGDITSSFGVSNFRIDGALDLNLRLAAVPLEGLPRFETDFKFG